MLQKLFFYGAIGFVALAFDLTIFSLLLSINTPPLIANTIGISVGVAVSYLGNFKFTFKAQGRKLSTKLLKFLVVNIFGLILSSFILYLLMFSMPPIFAKILTIPFIAITQFLLNLFWTFTS